MFLTLKSAFLFCEIFEPEHLPPNVWLGSDPLSLFLVPLNWEIESGQLL